MLVVRGIIPTALVKRSPPPVSSIVKFPVKNTFPKVVKLEGIYKKNMLDEHRTFIQIVKTPCEKVIKSTHLLTQHKKVDSHK